MTVVCCKTGRKTTLDNCEHAPYHIVPIGRTEHARKSHAKQHDRKPHFRGIPSARSSPSPPARRSID